MKRIHKKFLSFSSTTLISITFVLLLVVGFADFSTGYRFAFSVFYFIPIFIASYYLGLIPGVCISLLAAIFWLAADFYARGSYINNIIPVWNMLIRLSVFLILSFSVCRIRTVQKRKADLINFIVHDLRTPLTIILQGLYVLMENVNEENKGLVEVCSISCYRMNTLIDSILDTSKIESGKMEINVTNENIKNLIDTALKGVSVWAERNEIEIVSEYKTDLDEIRTDKELVYRVLINLLSNAIKWSPPKTTVAVEVLSPEKDKIMFKIKDEGKGVPGKMTKKVFKEFVQIHDRVGPKTSGSGLGLNFCKLAIKRLGGKIWMDSREGGGTEVVFELPAGI